MVRWAATGKEQRWVRLGFRNRVRSWCLLLDCLRIGGGLLVEVGFGVGVGSAASDGKRQLCRLHQLVGCNNPLVVVWAWALLGLGLDLFFIFFVIFVFVARAACGSRVSFLS